MNRPFRLAVSAAAFWCLIEIVLWFFATSARARLNITQFVSVLFFATLVYRLARAPAHKDAADIHAANSDAARYRESVLGALAMVSGIAVWTTMLPYYFISDDFGLLYMSRTPVLDLMWGLFRHGDGVFYRPLGFSSFAWDHAIWGLRPAGYHLTNLLLHISSIVGLFAMLRQLGVTQGISAMTAGIFAVMPVQVESVAWMSGRFDVLSATLAVWTVTAYAWSRSRDNTAGYVAALLLYVLAIFSKETGFVLPLLLIAVEFIVFRSRPGWRIGGFVAVGGMVFVYRMFAIGGIGGYQSGGGSSAVDFGFKTFEGLLVRGPSQMLFGLNWTQPSGIFVISVAAAMATVFMLLATGALLGMEQRRMIQLALVWTLVTMIPAHFLLMIGPGLSNSRILCLPAIGIVILIGQLLGSIGNRRFRVGMFIALVTLLNLGARHNLEAWRWTTRLGEAALQQIVKIEPSPPPNAQFIISNLPDTVRGVFFFRAGLNESLKLAYGRDDITALHDSNSAPPAATSPEKARIHLVWEGESGELLVRQNQ